MRHEIILVREDKTKLKITASSFDCYGQIKYRFKVDICLLNKRTYSCLCSTDDYQWRKLDTMGRQNYEMNKYLEYVTKEEIMYCVTRLWETMKPDETIFGEMK